MTRPERRDRDATRRIVSHENRCEIRGFVCWKFHRTVSSRFWERLRSSGTVEREQLEELNWGGRRVSNPRPPEPQSGVLPLNYAHHTNGIGELVNWRIGEFELVNSTEFTNSPILQFTNCSV